jgi:hypothetical protein
MAAPKSFRKLLAPIYEFLEAPKNFLKKHNSFRKLVFMGTCDFWELRYYCTSVFLNIFLKGTEAELEILVTFRKISTINSQLFHRGSLNTSFSISQELVKNFTLKKPEHFRSIFNAYRQYSCKFSLSPKQPSDSSKKFLSIHFVIQQLCRLKASERPADWSKFCQGVSEKK